MLERELILRAFKEMDAALAKENKKLQICVYGGAAMILQLEARETTGDIDIKSGT